MSPMIGAHRRASNLGDCDSHNDETPQTAMSAWSITRLSG
jgi:hypothetical protein